MNRHAGEPAAARKLRRTRPGLHALPIVCGASRVTLYPQFLPLALAEACFHQLRGEVDWQQERLRMFGREVLSPRLVAWYGDPGVCYRYSGLARNARAWTDSLRACRELLQRSLGLHFNGVLLNLYRDGADGMGWHADDEPELGECPSIVSLSLGATRRLLLRERAGGASLGLDLTAGSLLLMAGSCQRDWQHRLAKTRRQVGPRINLTFRLIV